MSSAGVREFLLAFADDEHLMGQQHTEWIGVAPFLEEDLAFSSIGQDELGHAALLYELVLDLDGTAASDEAVDALAYRRSSADYRSCHLVERTTVDWAEALVRHWIYDTFEAMRWGLVADSSLPGLGAIARRARREEEFHLLHADALLDRLLPEADARRRILDAVDAIAPMVPGLCEPAAGETEAITAGAVAGPTSDLREPLEQAIAARFALTAGYAGAAAGPGANAQNGRTRRSDHFEPLMLRMREVLDFDREAKW